MTNGNISSGKLVVDLLFVTIFVTNALNHSNEEEEGEADNDQGGRPGNGIEDGTICISHHQLLIIDEQKHEDENKGENHSIDHM